MNKKELIENVAQSTGLSMKQTAEAIDTTIGSIKDVLKKGNKVTLVGFGTFSVSKKKARMGRNPQTGEAIKISARKAPKFTAGKGFKDSIK